ncbi:hypothetical protein TNCV_3057601 [Trichonephila clavipes]|nr:hypothetical protein TNCV_3057601 [Trichonephila clavipes]
MSSGVTETIRDPLQSQHQSGLRSPRVIGLMNSGVTETIRDPPEKSGFGPQAGSYNYVASVRPWVPYSPRPNEQWSDGDY